MSSSNLPAVVHNSLSEEQRKAGLPSSQGTNSSEEETDCSGRFSISILLYSDSSRCLVGCRDLRTVDRVSHITTWGHLSLQARPQYRTSCTENLYIVNRPFNNMLLEPDFPWQCCAETWSKTAVGIIPLLEVTAHTYPKH